MSSLHPNDLSQEMKPEENGREAKNVAPAIAGKASPPQFMTGLKLLLACFAFLLSTFLSSLDQSIVSTAIPAMVSRFQALDQVTWIPGAYFLTQAGLVLTAGQLLTVFPPKYVYVCSIAIFECGSLVCAVAQSMTALIVGRAIAGCGAAAMFTSVSTIDAEIIPLDKRPILFGSFGVVVALAVVLGPLLGGVLTDRVSWRWCFYINLPLGALAIILVFFVLERREPRNKDSQLLVSSPWIRLGFVDWVGSVVCMSMVVALLLPLQWGGITKSWRDVQVVALFSLSAVLFVLLAIWEWRRRETALVPLGMLRRRSQFGATFSVFFIGLGLFVGVYYLPLWFQAKGHSATKSGVDILPFMISVVVSSGVTAGIVTKLGRYWWIIVVSPLIFSVGSGLLFTLDTTSPTKRVIGYQILAGIGLGGNLQNVFLAIHAEWAHEPHMIPQAVALCSFMQLTGGTLGIPIAGTIFRNKLKDYLAAYASEISEEALQAVQQSVDAIFTLPIPVQELVISAYIRSLNHVFLLGIPAGILACIFSAMTKNYNLKTRTKERP
ncbi:ABC transporter [Mycena venus]|uniref:ABC transporter n=1 Tax=Mycena venus TaxID=2733690 RepID=A0A8H7DF25_9AGAR|nr:ABC transporter [Mycena venus]